ncbi:dipeptidase PepE [Ancrocorticia sp.]|uniref:dipeptidase PepE n=1 Tax=Ancrocorticia sp. TaxID=2593684 RepID=UPI003F937E05
MDLLLLSNSTNHGSTPWAHAREAALPIVDGRHVLFLPYALADYDEYTARIARAFEPMGARITGIHSTPDPIAAIHDAEAIYVGGGNTWRLLRMVQRLDLLAPLDESVRTGTPYLGASAGTNLACPTIRTANDMPIVEPDSFDALGLVDFQINPHYVDPDPESIHMGETREKRIHEFHEENDTPVLGIREGGWLRISDTDLTLAGETARLFLKDHLPVECELGKLTIPAQNTG